MYTCRQYYHPFHWLNALWVTHNALHHVYMFILWNNLYLMSRKGMFYPLIIFSDVNFQGIFSKWNISIHNLLPHHLQIWYLSIEKGQLLTSNLLLRIESVLAVWWTLYLYTQTPRNQSRIIFNQKYVICGNKRC